MVDTVRTKAALQTLLADNTTGDISPQDLRDMLVSIMGVYGGIHIEGGVTGQAVVAATPELLTEWLANGVADGVTPDFTADNITIDNNGVYQIEFAISLEGIAGAVFEFHLRKNGVDTAHGCQIKTANNDTRSTVFSNQLALVATDVLTIWVESDIGGTFTVNHGDLNVRRIG